MRHRKLIIPASLVLALLLVGCAKNANTVPQTPFQKVALYNGVLAESNHAATDAAIALQKSGTLTVSQTLLFLNYTERVATASKAIAVLQQSSGDWPTVAAQIKILLGAVSPPGGFSDWLTGPQSKTLLDAMTGIAGAIYGLMVTDMKANGRNV